MFLLPNDSSSSSVEPYSSGFGMGVEERLKILAVTGILLCPISLEFLSRYNIFYLGTHAIECYLAFKKKEILSCVITWIMGDTMLSKISQSQDKYCLLPLIGGIQNRQIYIF